MEVTLILAVPLITDFQEPKQAAVQIGLMVLAAGLSLLAGKLLAPKSDSPLKGDKPTTLATRGSYIPWFVGVRRVGPVICWAGDRETKKEKVKGAGKGGDAPKQDVYFESAWHVLGVGPVVALYQIIQRGEVIFNGPITNSSHPSGTTVDLGKEGSFAIYWGEGFGPINTFLGDPSRVGVSSRWPHVCYIVWIRKRLGLSDSWPILDYVVERRPSFGLLSQSQSWYDADITASGETFNIFAAAAHPDPDIGYLEFQGDITNKFEPNSTFEISGNSLPDGLYQVQKSETVLVVVETFPNGFFIEETRTRVFLQTGTSGANQMGTAEPYFSGINNGANIAHVTAEMLFASFPQGMEFDSDHIVESWDIDSLEDLGIEAQAEGWRSSVLATEGEKVEAVLGGILQDHGVLLPINTISGSMSFKAVRFPSGTLPALSANIYAEKLPEIETMHAEMPVDRLMFSFSERIRSFGDTTITIDEDGQASRENHQRARTVPLISTVFFPTAASLAELRSPEELAPGGEFRIDAGREARDLIPGDAITAAGFDEVLRITGVGIDPLSERVTLKVLPDFYGARKSDFITGEGADPAETQDPEQDEQFIWAEIPEHLLSSGFPSTQAALIPRIRAHSLISFATLWLSRDNSTYTAFGEDDLVQTGGTLIGGLSADSPTYVDEGPEYTELGPDNSSLVQDLSADLTNWGLGRQLCVIWSPGVGTEICFLQRATVTGGNTRRLDGLLRARYDTRKLEHVSGARVFIFDIDVITLIQDVLLEPDVPLYVKTQPGTDSGQVNLSAVPPFGNQLYGKGQVPIQPDYVHVRAPFRNVPAFQTGDDITISWAISTGSIGTGAGLQSAGSPISTPEIPGSLQIELLTSGDVVQDTIGVDPEAVSEYTISNAELVSAFGSEPSTFKVRVTHVANGHASPSSESLSIVRVA